MMRPVCGRSSGFKSTGEGEEHGGGLDAGSVGDVHCGNTLPTFYRGWPVGSWVGRLSI